MDDQTPYIIVDNQRIAPLLRGTGACRAEINQPAQAEPPFGVVDRVTISSEARRQCRLYLAHMDQANGVKPNASRQAPELKTLSYNPLNTRQR